MAEPASGIRVYNHGVFAELARDAALEAQAKKVKSLRLSARDTVRKPADPSQIRYEQWWKLQAQNRLEEERRIQERIEQNRRRKEAGFQRAYEELMEGQKLAKEAEEMIELHDNLRKQKQLSLYNDWVQQVFDPLQKKLLAAIDGRSRKDLNRLRNEEYAKFLKATNTKAGLFRDIILDDYDPLELNRHNIVCDLKVADPVKRALTKTLEEKAMVNPAVMKPSELKAKQRETLSVLEWGSGKIEATPHGHFARLHKESESSQSAEKAALFSSKIMMDHYSFPRGRKAVDAEYPRGKKTTAFDLPNRVLAQAALDIVSKHALESAGGHIE